MEILRMGKIARDSLKNAIESFFTQDDKLAEAVLEAEETVDILTEAIQSKLIALRAADYSSKVHSQVSQLILVASDIERISDHAENIVEYEDQLRNSKAVISEAGMNDLRRLAEASMKAIDMAFLIFENDAFFLLPEAEKLEQEVDDIQKEIINSHIQRLMQVACDPAGGVIYTDISTDLERCSDHAINIAGALAEIPEENK